MVKAKEFVIFSAGSYGAKGTYGEKELNEIVETFNASEPPHVIVGHSSDYKGATMIPSFGKILGALKKVGNNIVAVGTEFADSMAEWIRAGYFVQRSAELVRVDGKTKIVAIGMLGSCPPSVKNLPFMQIALKESAMQFSEPAAVIEFDGKHSQPIEFDAIADVEKAFTEDTIKDCTEACATFISKLQDALAADIDDDKRRELIYNAMYDMDNETYNVLGMHFTSMQKLENIEENGETEMAARRGKIVEFFKSITGKGKEKETVTVTIPKETADKIIALEAQVKEFADAKAKADADAETALVKSEQDAADATLKASVIEFCAKSGKPAKAIETQGIVNKMFSMAKALNVKEFATETAAGKIVVDTFTLVLNAIPTVKIGESTEFSEATNKPVDARPAVIVGAEKYVSAHPIEFDGQTKEQALASAIKMNVSGQIKFE